MRQTSERQVRHYKQDSRAISGVSSDGNVVLQRQVTEEGGHEESKQYMIPPRSDSFGPSVRP